MPLEPGDILRRVKNVQREYSALRFTTDYALRSLSTGNVNLDNDLKRADVNRASERLEGTYIIRLFSEFEVALKTILLDQMLKRIPAAAKPLINRVATHFRFSGQILDDVHAVREYRNRLVHHLVHDIADSQRMTIPTASKHLCTFLSRAVRW